MGKQPSNSKKRGVAKAAITPEAELSAPTLETKVAKKPAAKKPAAKRAPAKKTGGKTAAPPPAATNGAISNEAIALRAYFLSEERRKNGLPSDPSHDWLEAERQLLAETKA